MQEDQNPLFFLGVPRGNHEAPIFFFSGAGGGGREREGDPISR